MKSIFAKSPPIAVRLFIVVVLSCICIFLDGRSSAMIQVRSMLETAVSGLYYFANTPRVVLDGVSHNFIDGQRLKLENQSLREQVREKSADLLLLEQLKAENQRLRLLLNSPLRQDEYKKVAEALTAEMDAYRQQVVINQGKMDGAFVGQPVIDEKGVVGQVISVGEKSSRVLLLTDVTHAIPVQVLRNDVRGIASGTGNNEELILDHLPRTVDVEKGDVLVTSGLGGTFPEGYPVAIVETVVNDGSSHFARVTARPLASLERLRYLLLIWPTSEELRKAQSISPQDVRNAVEERRRSLNPLDRLKASRKAQVNIKDESETPAEEPIENPASEQNDNLNEPNPTPTGEGAE